MHRRFIALVIGTALAVASLVALPVQAQNRNETAAIIAGVMALGIVGAVLVDDRKNTRRRDRVASNYGYNRDQYEPKHDHKTKRRYAAREHHESWQRQGHRGKRYDDRRYSPYSGYGGGYRYDDHGYRRGDGK